MIYKPRAELTLSIPKFGSRTEFITLNPRVIAAKWTRNNHLVADELTVKIGWKESGVDPRVMKYARCGFALWDAIADGENPNPEAVLRFTGIAHKAKRHLAENGWEVEIDFLDYTSMFIGMKPFPTSGMPEWSDTLDSAWKKICDHTGFKDPATGKIVSSVEALRDGLTLLVPSLEGKTLGEVVADRFHAVSKPTPPLNSDAWAVWQYVICSLGLISYIDKNLCIVTDTTEHYLPENAPKLIYGENILEFEEESDSGITNKGVLLKSFDPLKGRVIEAAYPPPGDDRLRTRRAVANRAAKEGREPTLNELSADYEEFNSFDVTDQAALERKAEKVYEERKRQEIRGKIKTREMVLFNPAGDTVSTLDLSAGDAIVVGIDQDTKDALSAIGDPNARIQYLVERCGYEENLARLIVEASESTQLKSPVFHIKTLAVDLQPESFDIDIDYHNLIVLD